MQASSILLLMIIAYPGYGQAPAYNPRNPDTRTAWADEVISDTIQRPRGLEIGSDVGRARILGDHIAIALARRLRLPQMAEPDITDRTLKLLADAFSEPSLIEDATDRRPAVALLILDYLANSAQTASQRLRAGALAAKLLASASVLGGGQ
jgi:hypothetical protein